MFLRTLTKRIKFIHSNGSLSHTHKIANLPRAEIIHHPVKQVTYVNRKEPESNTNTQLWNSLLKKYRNLD